MKNLNLELKVMELECRLEAIESNMKEWQDILDDESVSDEVWEIAQRKCQELDGKRIDTRSKLSSAKCNLRVAEKLA